MLYYTEFAMYIWDHSLPIINCMFSKCSVWKRGHAGKIEKRKQTFSTLPPPLPDAPTHTSCSTTFVLHATGLVDLEVAIVYELYLKYAQIMYQKVAVVHVWAVAHHS